MAPYQMLRSNGNSAVTLIAGPVAEIMLANLAVIVRQTVRVCFGFRKQQQARVLVSVGGEQNGFGGLEVFVAFADVLDAGNPAVRAGHDASDLAFVGDHAGSWS